MVSSEGSQAQTEDWLLDHGPRELELLFRAIVFHPSAPILIADWLCQLGLAHFDRLIWPTLSC
jgi:hypothetical protein